MNLKIENGGRLDQVLAESLNISRSKAQEIIKRGVKIDGRLVTKCGFQVRPGLEISFQPPDPEPDTTVKTEMNLKIIYEDQWLLIVDKPRGLVVHPAPGHHDDTLVNGLAFLVQDYGDFLAQEKKTGFARPGIVHRIDKDTAGLLVVAKDGQTAERLTAMISGHEVRREYLALVYGHPAHSAFTVDAPIGRSKYDRLKMTVDALEGKNAITHFRVFSQFNRGALIKAELETGRTHQIRVHLAYAGYPVVGDPVYGRKHDKIARSGQCLHAFKLSFRHPQTGRDLIFYSPIDEYFKGLLQSFATDHFC